MKYNRGAVLPLIAVSLAVMMGFAGIAVDVGYLEYWQQQQQTATDAAALGGAEYLAHSGCTSGSGAESVALADAKTNGFTNGAGNVTVSPVSPPSAGPYAANDCAVSVQITSSKVGTFFARLFGYPSGMAESTSATATASTTNTGTCIYLLSPNTYSSFNGATVNAPGCAIAINYTADFNSGTIASPSIGYAGPAPNYGNPVFTMATPGPMLPVADPCPEIAGCAAIAASPPPATNCQSVNTNGQPTTLQHGCYSNLNLDPPGAVTMDPGTYVITGNFNNNGVPLTGSGVTIYVTSTGTGPNLDEGPAVTLTPPTSGPYTGVLYYQVPSNSTSINFNGSTTNLTGLIYAPGSTSVNYDNNYGTYVVLVFGSMNFNQNTAYDIATPSPGQSLITKAVLAE